MTAVNLKIPYLIFFAVLYTAYLCWVMFGGMRRKKVKPTVYVIMSLLMLYGLIKEYDGICSSAETLNIFIVLLIGFVKGIYLGHKKITEKINDIWYIRHDCKYIIAWIIFFAIKIICTAIIKAVSKVEIPLWHIILYFCFYYPWRTFNVFLANPKMRHEVLTRKQSL